MLGLEYQKCSLSKDEHVEEPAEDKIYKDEHVQSFQLCAQAKNGHAEVEGRKGFSNCQSPH